MEEANADHKEKRERGHLHDRPVCPRLDLQEAVRFQYFANVFRDHLAALDGDIVECGVGWGRSMLYLCLLSRIENAGRRIWGFDSFEGFPQPTDEDRSPRNPQKGEWQTDLVSVFKMLEESGLDKVFLNSQLTLVKGFFSESLVNYTGEKIALLHADADLYQSYHDIFDHLFPKVVPGGVILFDEYLNTFEYLKWPGAKKAIDDTFLKHCRLMRDPHSGKYFAIKEA